MSEVDRQRLIPELAKFASELDRRFAEIGRMLEGRPPERGPISVPLNLEDKGMASLSPFHRAALLLYRSHLQEIDKLTRDLFETVADIRNFTRAKIDPTYERGTAPAIGARSRAPRERRTMVHGPVAGVAHRPLRAGHPGYGRVHRSHQYALDGALRHAAASDRAHLLADCIRPRSRRRHLRPGDAPPRELRRPGGCAFRGCLPDLLPVPSTNTGRSARRRRSGCSPW